jgi:hypothetical protein
MVTKPSGFWKLNGAEKRLSRQRQTAWTLTPNPLSHTHSRPPGRGGFSHYVYTGQGATEEPDHLTHEAPTPLAGSGGWECLYWQVWMQLTQSVP